MNDHREMTPERKQVLTKINQMMDESYGCAEAFIAAVSEYLWGELDDSIIKISTGFSGGVGGTHEELGGGGKRSDYHYGVNNKWPPGSGLAICARRGCRYRKSRGIPC